MAKEKLDVGLLKILSKNVAEYFNNIYDPNGLSPNNFMDITNCDGRIHGHMINHAEKSSMRNLKISEAYNVISKDFSEEAKVESKVSDIFVIPSIHVFVCAWCPRRFPVPPFLKKCNSAMLSLVSYNESMSAEQGYADMEILPPELFGFYWGAIDETGNRDVWAKSLDEIRESYPDAFKRPEKAPSP